MLPTFDLSCEENWNTFRKERRYNVLIYLQPKKKRRESGENVSRYNYDTLWRLESLLEMIHIMCRFDVKIDHKLFMIYYHKLFMIYLIMNNR